MLLSYSYYALNILEFICGTLQFLQFSLYVQDMVTHLTGKRKSSKVIKGKLWVLGKKFLERRVKVWNRLLKEGVRSPFLGIFKTICDKTLRSVI